MVNLNEKSLVGLVEESRTRKVPKREVTDLKVSPIPESGDSEVLEMVMHGRHRIDVGETIRAYYETHSGVHWISRYDILGDFDRIIYSDVCD